MVEENKDKYIPFYDDFLDVWNVKDTADGVCYPMTGENMAREVAALLSHYDGRLHAVLDELYVKDRKLEELGVSIDVWLNLFYYFFSFSLFFFNFTTIKFIYYKN